MTAQERLLALLNSQITGKALRPSDVTFGTPTAIEPIEGRNTEVIIYGNGVSGYKGQHRLLYRRIDLATITHHPLSVVLPAGSRYSSYDVVDRLNVAFNLDLDHSDIQYEDTLGSGSYELKAVVGGLRWVGSGRVEITRVVESIQPPLTVTELGEFTY